MHACATCVALQYGVVYVNGSGYDTNMDHHRLYPYGTLWSNLRLGQGQSVSQPVCRPRVEESHIHE
jgi:hypothetical protein